LKPGEDGRSTATAVIVGVGDELLLGHTANTNGAWLGYALSTLGLQVVRQEMVGDGEGQIQQALARGLEDADLVLLTGGLGPTPDDRTRSAVAAFFGLPLEEDPDLMERLKARFKARGYAEIPPTNRRMADVPSGAVVLPNPVGSAPGLALAAERGKTVVLLPGIPAEMRGVFSEGVSPFLRETLEGRLKPAHHRVIHTTGIPESLLAHEVEGLLPSDLGPVSLAYLPDLRGVRLRFTAQGISEKEAEGHFDNLEAMLEGVLRPFRYRSESGDLAQALAGGLISVGATVATAESCTGGLIAKRITDIPGSSKYFLGGTVAYSNAAKVHELGVSPALLEQKGAVSAEVAEAMARGVAERFGAVGGIGVTGVAGPGGGSEEKPVGMVCYASVLNGSAVSRTERFLGDREAVRERAAQAAMALFLATLEGSVR